jgi:hypothetical protein
VKRIDNFLKRFGLSSIVITLGYILFSVVLFPDHPFATGDAVGILCIFGSPCAVCGLLQYDSARPLYGIFIISKYTGLFCWISAVFLSDPMIEYYLGDALVAAFLMAWMISILCAVSGMKFSKYGISRKFSPCLRNCISSTFWL